MIVFQINSTLTKFLKNTGYCVDCCFDGDQALWQFFNKGYHLVVLDIMLPGMNEPRRCFAGAEF